MRCKEGIEQTSCCNGTHGRGQSKRLPMEYILTPPERRLCVNPPVKAAFYVIGCCLSYYSGVRYLKEINATAMENQWQHYQFPFILLQL